MSLITGIWIGITGLFVYLVGEWSVSSTIGSEFVHEKSRDLLLDELDKAELNPFDTKILRLSGAAMNGWFIADSCHSIRSRYYMNDASGNLYRIPRFSKCHQDVKECFERLKINRPLKPRY